MARDYYEVLGVSRSASAEELQSAFRTLARRYHPDINSDPAAEERFKELNEAYHVLADPDSRARYDRFGPDFRQVREDAGAGRSGGGPSTGRARRTAAATSAGINIEDLFGRGDFDDLFGAWRTTGPIQGADQEAELELSVPEAFTGGKRRIALGGPTGQRTYDVTVPPGVTDGQRIRLSGQGGQGAEGGPSGDLYLRVRIKPDEHYRVQGRDIYVDAPVAPWEAALGATVPILTPGGEVKMKVPAGSSSGRRLRLSGEGMPNRRGRPGDLYAELRIVVPHRLRKRERELFEELARESPFDARGASR
ncbi:MAG: molecular chaperone DnaJ [Frankiales bacterium]|nr:molecular chaperone DnaJ [Frankiales bacterium]